LISDGSPGRTPGAAETLEVGAAWSSATCKVSTLRWMLRLALQSGCSARRGGPV